MNATDAHYFSPDYSEARARFRDAARRRNAMLWQLPLTAKAPDGGELTIDIAWLGSRRAERAIVHSSGLHGVEGFAGSAIQLALLEHTRPIPEDGALILVHTLNPYGMAWLRRCNESNVDLNRNFDDDLPRDGSPRAYQLLDGLLNPCTPPGADFFYLRAAYYVLRHGFKPLKQAVAGGQYDFPKGLFFGGKALEEGAALYRRWLVDHLSKVERLFAVDVHTGLGPWGHDSLIAHAGGNALPEVEAALGREIARDVDTTSVTYEVRGGHARAFDGLVAPGDACIIMQEFGTYPGLRVLHALREENRAHQHAGGTPSHPAKLHLRRMFAPPSPRWRSRVVESGRRLVEAVSSVAFRGSGDA